MHGVHTGASAEAEDAVASMALDFVETCNESDVLASFLPSLRAVAAVSLARIALQVEPSWTPELAVTSQFSYEDVRPCIVAIVQYVGRGMFFFFLSPFETLVSFSFRIPPGFATCLPSTAVEALDATKPHPPPSLCSLPFLQAPRWRP